MLDSLARARANLALPVVRVTSHCNSGDCGGFCGESVSKLVVNGGNSPIRHYVLNSLINIVL